MYLLSVLSQFRGSLWPCSAGIFAWLRFVTWESNSWGKFFPTCWNITTSILRSVSRLLGRACLCHVILLCDFATWFCHVICHAILSRDFCHVIYQWLVGQAGFSIDLHYVSPWCAIWRLIYLCTVKESSDMSPKIVEVSFYYFERLGYMATGRTQRLEGKFVCYPAKYLFSK